MTKHISAYILSLVVILVLFLYGCGSNGGGVKVTPSGDRDITSREGVIDGQGSNRWAGQTACSEFPIRC